MKVIYIGTYNKGEILSGPEKVSKRIFEEYSKTDNTVFIHYFHEGDKYGYFKKLFGYEKTDEVNGSEVIRLGIFSMLYRLIKSKPDIIHILCFNRFVLFVFLLKIFMRVKIFYTLNGIIRHENKYYNKEPEFTVLKNRITENVIIYFSDRIFYLSEFSKSILCRYYTPDNRKLSKAKNGLDDCFLEQGIGKYPVKEYNSIVFIGNVDQKEKGFYFLYNALIKSNYNIKLYIIDTPDKINRFKEYSNIEVNIVGKMTPPNMIEFLRDKRMLVSPSEYDTYSISSLEAISCGLRTVLTSQTGLSEMIRNIPNVSVINYGDETKLIDEISVLSESKIPENELPDLNEFRWSNVMKDVYLSYYHKNT